MNYEGTEERIDDEEVGIALDWNRLRVSLAFGFSDLIYTGCSGLGARLKPPTSLRGSQKVETGRREQAMGRPGREFTHLALA